MATRKAFLEDPEHRIRVVYTPRHASWLNQIELWSFRPSSHPGKACAEARIVHLDRRPASASLPLHRALQCGARQALSLDIRW